MSYEIGTAADVPELMTKLNAFLLKGHALEPAYTGVGTGVIQNLMGTADSVLEVITVTFSDADNFTVAGSLSGDLGAGTVGDAFVCDVCTFTIAAGGTPWANGGTVQFTMTPAWTQKRASNPGTGTAEYIWMAPGNDTASQIFVGAKRFTDATGDYDNLRLLGCTGFDNALAFNAQPGACTNPVLPLLRTGVMPYWFIANGRRVIVLAKASTVYEMAYLGFLLQYQNPSQFPYPLVVGGSMSYDNEPVSTSAGWRWSVQSEYHRAFPFSGYDATNYHPKHSLRLRSPIGTWIGYTCKGYNLGVNGPVGYNWPYNCITDLRPNLDGSYPLFPVILAEDFQTIYAVSQIDGELDGVYALTGYAQAAENIITVGRTQYLVVQNIYRTTKTDYCALKLA